LDKQHKVFKNDDALKFLILSLKTVDVLLTVLPFI